MKDAKGNRGSLDIVLYSAGMPFDGNTVRTGSLGGSESAAYYLAKELAARGHRVKLFTSSQTPDDSVDGVGFVWHGAMSQQHPLGERFELYAMNTPHDVLLIQRIPFAFHRRFAAKICVWQLHDLALYRSAGQMLGGMWQIDAVTTVSEWHAAQVREVWNLAKDILFVVPNGVDPELYVPHAEPVVKIRYSTEPKEWGRPEEDEIVLPSNKYVLLYQSRPERGLTSALELMQRAKDADLPVHLAFCAYENTVPQMRDLYGALYAKATQLGNCTNLGALAKPQLAELQQRCDLLLYPTKFEEVSCITAMEAMHAKLPMLTSACAALPETCTDSGTVMIPLRTDGEVDVDAFFAQLVEWFGGGNRDANKYPPALNHKRVLQEQAARTRTWDVAADAFERMVDECFRRRQCGTGAVLRDALEHSDIRFAQFVAEQSAGQTVDLITDAVQGEITRLYAFKDSAEAYAAHYAKHQGAYYDEFETQVIGEDVTQTTRYRGVQLLFAERVNAAQGKRLRVLDYGCAHGHYTIPLARTFDNCDFVGMDISPRAVVAATKWKERDEVANVEFVQGAQGALDAGDRYDVIIAAEVLEHVWDYGELLNKFASMLQPGGAIIATTPCGRWEHSGTVAFRTGREHMHHFERADILDICRGHSHDILHAPASHDRSGEALASWVWCVRPKPNLPLWKVDYSRKLKQCAPRQTVSACLIVKNGESTLRRCVESFVDWVDEIVICVDSATTDRTLLVCKELEEDFPNRPFLYALAEKSAARDGFDEARNESIGLASGDWVLWIDADEELREPWNMHKLLRPSMHNGYGFAQVHYSVAPEQVLTTDYPCRLFRNHVGTKFYGVVHEHPEQTLGKAVEYSIIRPDMKFLHHGYFDEETRRARYKRNLPLLKRDLEKFPTERPLNKFLWLRDIAQSIQFESERGGNPAQFQDIAREGIGIMEQIAEMPQLKMIADAMPYYSLCVATTGSGFDVDMTMNVKSDAAPDLAASMNLKGRFHSREFYCKLVQKFSQESTKHYEDRHL